jgi:peptidoglycan-N-acetylglucosamine deacetylase
MVRNKATLLGSLTFLLLMGIGGVIAQTLTSNATGTKDGYYYEFWMDDRGNKNGSMTLNAGGTFTTKWTNTENILSRKGKKFDDTKTYKELGDMKVTYECNPYSPSGTSYMCVYGWTRNPLIEYYIVESWSNYNPSSGGQNGGSVTLDGSAYTLAKATRTNQPSIDGTKTFSQFFSVRNNKRTSGTISISEHFKAWEAKGWQLGKMNEVSLCVEGYQSSGNANVTKNDLTVGGVHVFREYMNENQINGLVIRRSDEAINISGNSLLNQNNSNISIVNPMGKIFKLQNVVQNGSTLTLPTSYLPSGSYILRNGNNAVHQFVVNR